MNPWVIDGVAWQPGGRMVVHRQHAPLARLLPYCRAAGEGPPPTGYADEVRRRGWSVDLGDGGLGDTLLALGLVRALTDTTARESELQYRGPRPRLMRRCHLPLDTSPGTGPHTIRCGDGGVPFPAVPEQPPAWLDALDGERVEVHAALPMRYYLAAERALGVRLPAERAPLPAFRSTAPLRPFHVVFVSATSWPGRKDYGAGYIRIARLLARHRAAPWTFTLIHGVGTEPPLHDGIDVLAGPDAIDCIDVFASAEMVIGNDTGLTHLAALTEREDGTGPHVIGLHGRHAHTKWTTGSPRQHAIATPFSRMLAAADRCPVRDQLDDVLWAESATLARIPPELVACVATDVAGWR